MANIEALGCLCGNTGARMFVDILCHFQMDCFEYFINEPVHEISNNVVGATSKASDQPAHTRSLIRAFASRLSIL